MRHTQQEESVDNVGPAPGQSFCGRVEAVISDDGAGTVWLVTSSHAITVAWPTDARVQELPRKGEPVFYDKDLDVIAFGVAGSQRIFTVARVAWGLDGEVYGPQWAPSLALLSVISVLMLVLSFALLAKAYFHILSSVALDSQFACVSVAIAAVAALLQWKLVVPHWTSRSMVGIAPRTDVGADRCD